MRFESIEIQNFRSFPAEPTRIELPGPENNLVCVGANNAGKSNLVDAFRLVLGGLRLFSPDPADFHQLDLGRDLRID